MGIRDMVSDIAQIGTLFGSSPLPRNPNLFDVINGSQQNSSAAVLNGLLPQATTSLTSTQSNAIASLQDFVAQNVSGPEAEALQASIAGLQQLLESGSEGSANLDPVFSLLASNSDITGVLPSGTLVNQLF